MCGRSDPEGPDMGGVTGLVFFSGSQESWRPGMGFGVQNQLSPRIAHPLLQSEFPLSRWPFEVGSVSFARTGSTGLDSTSSAHVLD